MSDLFLTHQELLDLTGFKAPHCQARWLERHRWRYVMNRHNEPRVAREHFAERMGCGGRVTSHADAINQAAAVAQPNFAAINRR